MATPPPEPFDRARRRIRRDRAASRFAEHGFLHAHIAEELLARLAAVDRRFTRALILGAPDATVATALAAMGIASVAADPGYRFAQAAGGVQCDEDRLPFADASFDLVISAALLDSVNDLPGALILARRVLRPDGLFLAGFLGAGSLPVLRAAMLDADLVAGHAAPRIHPHIDVRAAGDLLGRAGLSLPVADGERLEVRYRGGLAALLADLRFGAQGGVLAGQRPALTKMQAIAGHAAFAARAEEDRGVTETFEIVYLIGWAPDVSQPRPARRGSATASLAAALRKKP